ncbi:MAG: endonuclease domain-containing protein [Pyrinomonadaceae bacterium]|nr:endonuclease domain-containing protein [Pyrinomonadaceae bacterium]MBP6213990.1 endonuclease domain-containing protein [Pyrinomonadaceae bacterium]
MPYSRSKSDIHTLPHLAEFRDELRKSLTPAEASFWNLVKNSRLDGRKFRRQHSIGNYILDFYCPAEKLAVELDGSRHYSGEGSAYDRERSAFLESQGIRVIRFENKMVFDEREWVADVIRSNFRFGPPVKFSGHAPHASERTTPSVSSKNDETATPPS